MIRFTVTSGLLVGFAAPCLAQGDMMALAHQSAANQLGIMEYCQSKGAVGADAVQAQRDAIARLPAATVDTATSEQQGKNGTLSNPNGQSVTLDSVASGQHTTVPALCQQLGNSAIQANAQLKQAGTGMPNLPGGMTMPAMPAMPSGMPGMPGMPKSP